jgi:hypothetical protein
MAKKKAYQTWVLTGRKPKPPAVPDLIKAEVEAKANELIEGYLKPEYIKPPPKNWRWNYLTGISTKWHGAFFYLVGHYACPGPNAISPTFETRFTRMEYAGGRHFHLAYFRHTGKWWEVFQGLTIDDCLDAIGDQVIFHPS